MAKPADTKIATGRKPATKATRSAKETETIRAALSARCDELRAEYDQTMSEIAELQRDRLTDSAGDDQADTGTKTFEREQEIPSPTTSWNGSRRWSGRWSGWTTVSTAGASGAATPIPVERLAAFPSATLCVTCKQLEERR